MFNEKKERKGAAGQMSTGPELIDIIDQYLETFFRNKSLQDRFFKIWFICNFS
jgi:hypothetical protein